MDEIKKIRGRLFGAALLLCVSAIYAEAQTPTVTTFSTGATALTVGTTTITSGTTNGLLYNNTGILGNLATANSGVLVTSGAGVPSISSTLPSGMAATNMTLTTPSLGVATATSINGNTITTGTGTLTLAAGKTLTISNTLTFAGTDTSTLNIGAGGTLASAAYSATGTSGATLPLLNGANTWSGPQRTNTNSPAIATATFTPVFSTSQNYRIVLVHASCPCTLANPAALVGGQSGMFEIVQSATGSDTIGTWGSEYEYVGGTSTITLSTAANTVDYIPYTVDSTGNFIVLGGIIKGAAH